MISAVVKPNWCVVRVCALGLLVGLTGCRTMPNAQPFRDATGSLKDAVTAAGAAVSVELKALPPEKINAPRQAFEQAWAARNAAMGALVDYAASVTEIVEAGHGGEAAAKRLADAGKTLTTSLGVVWPGATVAGGVVIDGLSYANGLIANARAAKSLEASLGTLHPAVVRIATIFQADLVAIDDVIVFAAAAESSALALGPDRASLALHRQLLATQGGWQESIREQLGRSPPVDPSRLVGTDELARVEAMLAAQVAWWADYQARQAAIAARARTAHQLIAEARRGFAAWADLHAQLLATVKTSRPPSAVEVLAAVGRIHGLVERLQTR